MRKKVLSGVLAACMALMVVQVPVPALGAMAIAPSGTHDTLDYRSAVVARAEGSVTGTCGTGLSWTLDTTTETLAISGTGAMANYDIGDNKVPWDSQKSNIQTVIISPGITSIGNYAFNGCNNLSSITIPDSVTKIGEDAFGYCQNLTQLEIPNGVKEIGRFAFADCSGLTEVSLPNSITYVETAAFTRCTNLKEVTLSNNMGTISASLFFECTALTTISIPDSVKQISSNAFKDCTSLTSINIPNSVTLIMDGVFRGCTNLVAVTLPDNLSDIQQSVFQGCTSLSSIVIPNKVQYIRSSAFAGCTSLKNITIPDSVKTIEDYAFSDCIGLKSITIPDNVTSIGDWAFHDCSALTSATLPNGITSIPYRMFAGAKNLAAITIPKSVKTIEEHAFAGCSKLSLTIPKTVTSIGEDAFSGGLLYGTSNVYPSPPAGPIYYEGSPDKLKEICGGELGLEAVFKNNRVFYDPEIIYLPTLTPASETVTGGEIVFTSDTDFDPVKAVDVTMYTVASEAAPAARSIGATPASAALSNNNRTLTLTLSGTEETDQRVSVTIPKEVFAVPVQNDTIITVTMTGTGPVVPPDPEPPEPEPPVTPTSRPSASNPVSTPKPTPTPTPTPRVVRVEKEVLVQTPPPVGISGEGESEYQDTVKEGEYVRWIDRLDLPRYATDLYTVLCIGGDYDTYYDLLINDKYYQFPTGGGSKGSSEVESVLELVSDLNLPYSSGSGVFQESHFAPGFDTVDTTLGDRAVDYLNLKEGDVVRTSTYNAVYVTKVPKDGATYDADLKAAAAYAQSAFQAFDRDHPEVFWLSGRSKLRMVTVTLREGNRSYQETYLFFVLADKDGFTIRDAKYDQAAIEADVARRDQAVEAILKTVTAAAPNEQAAQLNRWLTEHNEYNTSQDLQNLPNWPHECLSALLGSTGTQGPVCDGYSRAFKVLCDRLDIPCVLVDGYAKVRADSAGQFHMWNSAQMADGQWYGVDVTWNDPTVKGISGAKSGYEREDFLLVGADTVVLGLRFADSHPPKNRAADGGVAFVNGPTLSTMAYNPLAAAGALPFGDVKPEAWYYDAVAYVYGHSLMTGESETVFAPQDGMTRAMVWTVLGRMAGAELAGGEPWYASARTWAVAAELTDGSAPERTLSREELVTMLWRAGGSPAAEADLSAFADSGAVSAWAAPAVRWAVSSGVLEGAGGKLDPGGTASRAEVASLLMRFQTHAGS